MDVSVTDFGKELGMVYETVTKLFLCFFHLNINVQHYGLSRFNDIFLSFGIFTLEDHIFPL